MAAPGRLVAVCGAKGGVGATAVAANLAAALAREGETLLVALSGAGADDLALWFALEDGAPAADHRPVLAAAAPELLDTLTGAPRSGVRLLRLAGASTEDAGGVLRLARRRYPWVVADAGAWPGGPPAGSLAAAVAEAAVILVVFTPDPLAVRRARSLAGALKGCGRPVRGLVNRLANGRGAPDFGAALEGLELAGALSDARELEEAMLRGAPLGAEGRSAVATEVARLSASLRGFAAAPLDEAPAVAEPEAAWRTPAFRQVKRRLHQRFLDRSRTDGPRPAAAVPGELAAILDEERLPDLTPGFRDRLLKELRDEVLGLGPLQDLLDDPAVTEVMVNGPEAVYVERGGKLSRVARTLDGEEELRSLIERIVAPLGRRIDEASPLVDARLADGSRVNAVIPPLALKGSCLTIRKFSRRRLTVEDLVAGGSLSPAAAAFLRAVVAGRLNCLISGGTGSGKTTLLNILGSFIGPDERIVTVEDAAELKLPQDHVVPLESRPANLEGRGAVPIRELVRNALRMRPDRIVIGECRGGEALDMLQAMNTGHEGSLSTLHANTPRDALARLETMVLMAGMDLPLRAIREQVQSAVEIVVQIARLKDGSRRVTHVAELCGMEGDVYRLQDVFVRRAEGPLEPLGLVPRCAEKLADRGYSLDPGLFAG